MRSRALVALLAAASLAAVAAASAATEEERYKLKPGAKGKACVGCHVDFEETLKLPFVHTPVKSGACSDCHSPHASAHGKLLSADPGKICLECHGDMLPAGARSVHKAALEGGCVKCHDPHASKNKGSLKSAGNELCVSCHKDVAAGLAAARFKHVPVEKDCLGCHDPHASQGAVALLKKAQPVLCLDCHKPDRPEFAKAHMNYPVAKGTCSSCHDPHGSPNKGILWATAHAPVANRMCAQCHQDASAANALETKKQSVDLCRGCHSGLVNEMLAKDRLHWPVLDRAGCANCHTPHAAKRKGLLRDREAALCGSCHADAVTRQQKSLVKHEPIAEGNCTACHTPHASDGTFLLANARVEDLCGTCHDWQKHSTHPIGEKVVDQRNRNLTLDCLSCHRTHGSPYKYFAHYDTKMDLCVQCHQGFRR